jgi:type IV pilus assembly protein PilM
MPAKPTGVWGIDVGQCSFKALRLENRDGEVVATAFDFIEYPKILSQPDADPDALVRQALEQFLARNKVKGDLVAISVPGQTGLARFVKLPPVEEKKIPDIVRFEAKQQIPFPLDEVVWDWQTIRRGEVAEGFVENEIGLFALKREVVLKALQVFRDLKIEVHIVQMTPLALLNFAVFDLLGRSGTAQDEPPEPDREGKVPCLVVLDMGTDSSNLVITDGYRIIWQRPIPVGGNHFTRVLSKDMKLTFAKAEHLKRNATKAEDPRKVFQSMRAVFSDLAGEVSRSLGYFASQHRDAKVERLVGLGNGFRLPGMQKFLEQALELPVERLSQFQRLKGEEVLKAPTFYENTLTFGVAYGLALQGLERAKIHTNLLPPEFHRERFIRAKKPWLAATAAALLVGVTVYAVSAADKLAKATALFNMRSHLDDAEAEARKREQQAREEMERTRRALEAAEAMLRGNRERINWLLLHKFIVDCLPQPNGVNVPRQYLDKYWNTARGEAQQAYLRLRQLEERDQKYRIDRSHLIEINIQAVFARYVTPPVAEVALNRIYNESTYGINQFAGWPDWDVTPGQPPRLKNPPRQDGWLIEIQGFTYHDKGVDFVLETLVYNLRDPSKRNVRVPRDAHELRRFLQSLAEAQRNRALLGQAQADLRKSESVLPPSGGTKPSGGSPAGTAEPQPGDADYRLDIGYVALFQHRVDIVRQNQAKPFYKIGRQIWLNGLLRGGGGLDSGFRPGFPAGGGGSAPGGGGMDAGGRGPGSFGGAGQDWVGLGQSFGVGGPMGDAAPGRGGGGAVAAEPTPEKDAATRPLAPGELRRTEFVIIFFWNEPRPTEASWEQWQRAVTPPAGGAGMPGAVPGGGPGPGAQPPPAPAAPPEQKPGGFGRKIDVDV